MEEIAVKDNTTNFSIENFQPSWLETRQQKYFYQVSVGLISGLLISLIYALTTGWIGASLGGVSYGIILGCTSKIYPVTRLKFSIEYAKSRLLKSILEGLWWGILYGVIDALICWLIWGQDEGIWCWLQAIVWGLVEGLIWGVSVPQFKDMTVSDRGIKESANNAVIFTFIGGIAWLILYLPLFVVLQKPLEWLPLLLDTISSGLFFGIYMGGFACLQHFVLRFVLWWYGYIPWNSTQLLNDATLKELLKREVGACHNDIV